MSPTEPGTLTDQIFELRKRLNAMLNVISDPRPCKLCGTMIWFIPTKNGKQAPCSLSGLNHFADCPNADAFRKAKTGK